MSGDIAVYFIKPVKSEEYHALTLHIMASARNKLPSIQLIWMPVPQVSVGVDKKAECPGHYGRCHNE